MPNWLVEVVEQFTKGLDQEACWLTESEVRIPVQHHAINGVEVDFISENDPLNFQNTEKLSLSVNLDVRIEEALISKGMAKNHYAQSRPLQPSCFLFGSSLVLRTVLDQEQLNLPSLVRAYELQLEAVHELTGL